MRRTLTLVLVCSVGVGLTAAPPPQGSPAPTAPTAMLTVDSIMRGPKLVGAAPTNIRWSKDSTKIYFSWQRASDDHAESYVVGRDGTGLAPFSGAADVPIGGRADRAHRRAVLVENGDVVIIDLATGTRHPVTHTAAAETNARWARHDTAVTFMREGNLYLVPVDPAEGPEESQLTDVVSADTSATAGTRRSGS